jgi:hypothetical protein
MPYRATGAGFPGRAGGPFTLLAAVPAFIGAGEAMHRQWCRASREGPMSTSNRWKQTVVGVAMSTAISGGLLADGSTVPPARLAHEHVNAGLEAGRDDPALEWNQIFVETLIALNTANSASQRLGAIVHTAIFDAYNGIERRYEPIYVDATAPHGASRRAAVIAAAYTTLVSLFPAREGVLTGRYEASLAAIVDDGEDVGQGLQRGIDWGTQVAEDVLAWRAADGFNDPYPAFTGGMAVGQWRPTPPASAPMSAQALAFTEMFVLRVQFDPPPPRPLASEEYAEDFNAVKALGRRTNSTRTPDQTSLAFFWEGNASVHWNQAANQIARANHKSLSENVRLLALLNLAMADTAFTTWQSKRFYGADPAEVTWRPVTAIPLAATDDNPDTEPEDGWTPLINTPAHPEYLSGHCSLNGAAATILLAWFDDAQTFDLTTTGQPPRTYTSISEARAIGNAARVWGGMHYPSTNRVSDRNGAEIATWINTNALQPLHGALSR